MKVAPSQHRRQVTLLFSDLTDSTAIAAGMEPEHYADLLEHIRAIIEKIVPAHGGDVVRLDGDGVLCVFGHPHPHEDSGRRATEAALDLHAGMIAVDAAFATPNRPLLLHTGIHSGMVLLRSGDMVRGKYEVLGDATNVAARLCDAAAPGEILVSSETLGHEKHLFFCDEERSIAVSGRNKRLPVLRVKSRANSLNRAAVLTGLTPYIGRSEERDKIAAWLQDGAEDSPLMLIHGPAGIGKSRLVGQIADDAKASGWRVERGYCEAHLGARPLQPFLQIVSRMPDSPINHTNVNETALIDALSSLSHGDRYLLIIDDWQWADDATHNMLMSLCAHPRYSNLKVLLASRHGDAGIVTEKTMDILSLPPLGRDETLVTIETLLGMPDPFIISRIERASGGSPLLIEELCLAFASGDIVTDTDPRSAWFDTAVQARFAKLGDDEAALCRLAAVIGHIIPSWLLNDLLELGAAPKLLDRLMAADFLFPGDDDDTVRFKHGLTRDAVYTAIDLTERRALHKLVFDALEIRAGEGRKFALLDGLAYHSAAADDADKALPYAIAAGDAALAAGALDRAQAHYRVGLDIAGKMQEGKVRRDYIWALMNKFGLATIVDPAPDQLDVFGRVEALLNKGGNVQDQIRCAYWQGAVSYGVGLGKRSVTHLNAALTMTQHSGSQHDTYLIRVKLAQSLFASGQYAQAQRMFETLLPFIRSIKGRNNSDISAYALACFAFHKADQGDFDRAHLLFGEAAEILQDDRKPMNASFLGYQATTSIWQGNWQDTLALTETTFAVSKRSRTRHQNLISHAKMAYSRWHLEHDPRAATLLEQSVNQFLASGNSHQRASMVLGWAVDVLAGQGERAKARFYAGQMVQRIRVAGDRLGEAMTWRALARMEQASGDAVRADHYLALARHAATVRLSRREAAQNMLCEGELRHARGQGDAAIRSFTAAKDEFAAMRMPFFEAIATEFATR